MKTFSRETLSPWYVTGLIEGEGTFTYSRSGVQIGMYFALRLMDDEQSLLESLQDYFGGIGSLYTVVPRSGSSKTASYYRVTRHKDLLQVVSHFDEFPLKSSKAKAYAVWRKMVLLKQAFRKPDREKLNELARELSECCIRKRPWR